MKLIFISFYLLVAISVPISAQYKHIPAFITEDMSCSYTKNYKENQCRLIISKDGFLTDRMTKRKIIPINYAESHMMGISTLYERNGYYILNSDGYSATKTSYWTLFTYIDNKITIKRIYIFAKDDEWRGLECRENGNGLIDDTLIGDSSLDDLAEDLLCNYSKISSEKITEERNMLELPFNSENILNIRIPVHIQGKQKKYASYLFLQQSNAEKPYSPYLPNMLCYENCRLSKDKPKLYAGSINKNLWITMSIKDNNSSNTRAEYSYNNSKSKIKLRGRVSQTELFLTEYFSDNKRKRALFKGVPISEGFYGQWVSTIGDKKQHGFFLFPFIM